MATKSIIDLCQSLSSEEEHVVTNLEWITLYCGLSLGARLDIVAAQPQIRHLTKHLRRLSDMQHLLRQVSLRMEASSSDDVDDAGDRSAMHHLAKRVDLLEKWHLSRLPEQVSSSSTPSVTFTPQSGYVGNDMDLSGFAPPTLSGSTELTPESQTAGDSVVLSDIFNSLGSDTNFGDFLFTLPRRFDG